MDKHTLISFFDRAASEWDARMVTDERKIEYILDRAGVCTGSMVLDVACGTGVLFPYYLRRNPARVIAVDISPEMARIAAQKAEGTVIEVLCGDIETLSPETLCDCCVVYNAFPHFEDPSRLIARLARWVRPGGRITVAHSMSLDALHRHHAGRAEHVSRPMLSPQELTRLLSPWFAVDTAVSDEEKYVVSGVRLA
jgi:demethylmenaquinone methyltransferase/2-methoxy-6-polyprenyl-1,4-benzoquinol methylase